MIDEVCSVKLNIVCQIDLFDAGKSTGFHMDVQFQLKKNQQPRFDNKCPSADHYSHPPPKKIKIKFDPHPTPTKKGKKEKQHQKHR